MKLFVVSDIHSFYTPLIKALEAAGYDKNNNEHWLIVCGDCFDRGPESVEILHFLMTFVAEVFHIVTISQMELYVQLKTQVVASYLVSL